MDDIDTWKFLARFEVDADRMRILSAHYTDKALPAAMANQGHNHIHWTTTVKSLLSTLMSNQVFRTTDRTQISNVLDILLRLTFPHTPLPNKINYRNIIDEVASAYPASFPPPPPPRSPANAPSYCHLNPHATP
jgi:hypothetical protein